MWKLESQAGLVDFSFAVETGIAEFLGLQRWRTRDAIAVLRARPFLYRLAIRDASLVPPSAADLKFLGCAFSTGAAEHTVTSGR